MSVFESIGRKVSDTAKVAAKKSSELVEITKLNMSISAEEDKIKKAYTDMGKLVYEAYCNGERVSEAYKTFCDSISTCEGIIRETKQKILEIKNMKICPGCNEEVELDTAFCPKCGAKQEVLETKTIKVCPGCNEEVELDVAFCSKCGTKQ